MTIFSIVVVSYSQSTLPSKIYLDVTYITRLGSADRTAYQVLRILSEHEVVQLVHAALIHISYFGYIIVGERAHF